jgi:hypothetical protein
VPSAPESRVAVPRRVAHALDLVNFFLADVRDGLGPYLSIYLLLAHHWDQASIGFVMAVGGIGAIVAQAPAGALVDRTTAKRALTVGGALTITAGSLAMPLFPGFYSISVLASPHRHRRLRLRARAGRDHSGRRRAHPHRGRDQRHSFAPYPPVRVADFGFWVQTRRV